MAKANLSTSTFLNLPLEIRNCIYTFLLVEQDTFRETAETSNVGSNHIHHSENEESSTEGSVSTSPATSPISSDKPTAPKLIPSAIIISELHPAKYTPSRRTSYWTSNWDQTCQTQQLTTYTLGSSIDLHILHACRQIHTEASYIFYTLNRFYVDSIETLIPFLKDRPNHSLALLKTLSIPIPYGVQRDEDGDRIMRYYRVNNSTFEAACRQLSQSPELLANVKQLDLRLWDSNADYSARGSPDVSALRISSKRAKQLASIAEPEVMTFSFHDWQRCGGSGPSPHSVFEPLPGHVHRKIRRFREDYGLGTHNEEVDPVGEDDDDDSGLDENDDEVRYMPWRDILMGRRGTNAI